MPQFLEVDSPFHAEDDAPREVDFAPSAHHASAESEAAPDDALFTHETELADASLGDQTDPDLHIGFVAESAAPRSAPPAAIWPVVGAWAMSLAAHAAIAAGATWIVWNVAADSNGRKFARTPPVGHFALGDTADERGLRNRDGAAEVPPGVQVTAAAAALNISPSVDQETDVTPPIPLPPSQWELQPVVEGGVLPIAPPRESPLKLPEIPAFSPTKLNLAPAEATAAASTPAAPSNAGDGPTANDAASETMASAKVPPTNGAPGQDGATTGDGGTAATGLPGIRAGLRDGRKLIKPTYPYACRRAGEEGIVVLQVDVRADGSIAKIRVADDAGHPRLAEAAVRSLSGFVFDPAMDNGRPVPDSLEIPYTFRIENARR